MSDTLHDAAERLIASMPDGVPVDRIRQRARQRRRRRNITWIATAVVATTGGLATVRLAQQSARELVPADSAPAPSVSIAPTTTEAPAPTTVPATTTTPTTTPATTTPTTFPNRPPTAVSDLIAVRQDEAAVIAVLANDIDPDGDVLRLLSVSSVVGGDVTLDTGTGHVTFVPTVGMSGVGTFAYTIADDSGASSTATVTIAVGG